MLLLVGSLEVEAGHVGTRVKLAAPHFNRVVPAGDLFVSGLVLIERVAVLVDIAPLDGRADPNLAAVGLLLPGEHAEECGLARPIRSDDAHNAAGRQAEREVLDQQVIAVALADVLALHDQLAEFLSGGDLDFELFDAIQEFLGDQLVVSANAGLVLGLPGTRRQPNPLQFAIQCFLPGRCGFLFFGQPVALLFQPRRVVAFPRNAPAAVQFQNPTGDVVEKVAVVRHGHHGARVVEQMPFQPGHAFGIQVVGGLIQQQQIGALQEHFAQRHATPFSAGEPGHIGITRRQLHGVHGDFDLPVQLPGVHELDLILHAGLLRQQLVHRVGFERLAQLRIDCIKALQQGSGRGDGFFHVAEHIFVWIELRLLRHVAASEATGDPRFAFEILVPSRHDLEQRALARAIAPQHADLGAGIERQPDVFQHLTLAVFFCEALNLINVLLTHAIAIR